MAIGSFVDVDNLTYCGKEAQEIFSKRLYALDIANSGITLKPNVKGKEKIYNGEVGDLWQEYTCAFTPSGEVVLDEAYIEPVEIKINLEECYDKFWDTFLVEQTKIALDGGIPQTFSNWFFNEQLLPKMDREYQAIFWQGDEDYDGATKTYLAVTDGIEKKLAEGDAEQVECANLTVSNIIANVEAIVMKGLEVAATQEVDTDGYKIFMNYADVQLLRIALGKLCCGNSTTDVFSNYSKNGEGINVLGFDVVPTMCSRNKIIFGPAKNIVLGFDQLSPKTEYRLLDMREHTGDNSFRVIALANIAVGVIFDDLFTISVPETPTPPTP